MMYVNQTYYGDHFAACAHMESLGYISEINVIC